MLTDKYLLPWQKAFEASANLPLAERIFKSNGSSSGSRWCHWKTICCLVGSNATDTGKPWDDNHKVDLRVDDHALPLVELIPIIEVQRGLRAYEWGDLAVEKTIWRKSDGEYGAAMKMFPNSRNAILDMLAANSHQMAAACWKIYQDTNWLKWPRDYPK